MNDWVGVLNIAFSWSENSHGLKLNANVSIMTNTNLRSWDLCTVRRRDHCLFFFWDVGLHGRRCLANLGYDGIELVFCWPLLISPEGN